VNILNDLTDLPGFKLINNFYYMDSATPNKASYLM
jgi:hypothetical protein